MRTRSGPTVLAALCVLAAACGRQPQPPNPGGPDGEQITGTERIGWDQPAATAEELAELRHAAYVDGARRDLPDASCTSPPVSAGFPCSARLPAMTPGRHTIELVAYIGTGSLLESARSSPIVVVVVAAAAAAPPVNGPAGSADLATADGVTLRAEIVAGPFEDAIDLAVARDGRIYVAERAGRIRILRGGRLTPAPAVVLDDLNESDGNGLRAIAIDPDFDRTGFLFAAYTVAGRVRVARFRAVEDTLGDRAVVIDGIPVAGVVSLRFGPDRRLYLGVDDGGDPSRVGDLGSFNGKVLRFNADGTTPVDQAGGTPVFAANVNQPRALAWDAAGTMWVIDAARRGSDMLHAVVAESRAAQRGRTLLRYAFPEDTPVSGLALYGAGPIPELRGDLLAASPGGRALLRLRFDPADSRRLIASERLLQDVFGAIHAVSVASDGVIYLVTDAGVVRVDR